MISILKKENILEYSEYNGKYKIGTEMIRMASIISANVDVKKVAKPYLEEMARKLHHSVYLSLYYPQHKKLAFVDCVKSMNALQYVLDIGVLQPIHIAASGKCILAHLSDEEIEQVMDLEKVNPGERENLKDELRKIRKQGYAKTANERKEGALSFGAPIFDASDKVIGSVICVIPITDFEQEKEMFFQENVKKCAEKISYLLGHKRE